VDRGLHPGGLAEALEGVLEGERVDRRGEHAHVVGLGAVHARARTRHPSPDVPASDDDGDVDAQLARLHDLTGDELCDLAVDRLVLPGERLARELQQDSAVGGIAQEPM